MQVSHMMSNRLVTVEMDDKISLVKDIFNHSKLHHLPVVENHQLVGLVSERDLLRALNPNVDNPLAKDSELVCLNKRVHQIMSRKVITITADSSLAQAASLLVERNIGCLPVLRDNQLVGILTWKDVLKSFITKA